MNRIYIFAILFAYGSATTLFAQTKERTVSATEFQKTITTPNVQLLDVRTASEFNEGHLPGAMQADWYNRKQFSDRIQALDKHKTLCVYCLTGVRSHEAMELLKNSGFSDVKELQGGLISWKKEGRKVEQKAGIKQMTMGDFISKVGAKGTVLVDFGAEWCPPCVKMKPIVESLQSQAANRYKVLTVDAGTEESLVQQMNIEALPVFIVYKDGKLVWRKQGLVDMEEIKRHL